MKNQPELKDEDLPTIPQLAALSAAIAKSASDDPKKLADAALKIWNEAASALTRERQLRADCAEREAEAAKRPALLVPKKFPVRLDKVLRLLLPKLNGRTGEQFAILRRFEAMRLGPKEDDSAKASGENAFAPSRLYTEPEYRLFAEYFLSWYERQHKVDVTAQRKAAGVKSAVNRESQRKAAQKAGRERILKKKL